MKNQVPLQMFYRVYVRQLRDSQTCPEATPALSWLRVVVMLKVDPSPVSSRCALEHMSSKDLSVSGCIHPSFNFDQSPVPVAEKEPKNTMLPPPCFTVGMVLTRRQAEAGVPQT